jgi:ketosteroid isomerase-like protein
MTREQMDQLIEAHLGAEDAGDIAAAVAVYTDDVEHDVVGAPDGPLRGPEAVRRRYEQLVQNMRTVSMNATHQYYSDDACVVEHLCTCVVTGQFAGIEGHGRQVSFRLLHIFEFRAGKISRENVWDGYRHTGGAAGGIRQRSSALRIRQGRVESREIDVSHPADACAGRPANLVRCHG